VGLVVKKSLTVRVVGFVFLAVVSFLVVNAAFGTPLDPLSNDKVRNALSSDDGKPRVNGQIGDIILLDSGHGPDFRCPSGFDSHPGYAEAKGSIVAIEPKFLPAGLVEQQGGVTLCGDVAIGAARWWSAPISGGAVVQIFRFIRPEAWVNGAAPPDRLTVRTVSGRKLTILKEVIQDAGQARGNSGVFWADKLADGNFLVTAIYGLQISSDELVQVAGGMVP